MRPLTKDHVAPKADLRAARSRYGMRLNQAYQYQHYESRSFVGSIYLYRLGGLEDRGGRLRAPIPYVWAAMTLS